MFVQEAIREREKNKEEEEKRKELCIYTHQRSDDNKSWVLLFSPISDIITDTIDFVIFL